MILLLNVATCAKGDQDPLGGVLVHVHVASQGRDANGLQFGNDFEHSEGIFYCLQGLHGLKETNTTQLVTSVLDKNTLALNMRRIPE